MFVKRSEAIRKFLIAKTHPDLAELYSTNMECQVNVAQDGGTRVDKEFKGRTNQVWTDGVQVWYPIRIPKNANSDPIDNSNEDMTYDLVEHAEAIGMTGWNWKEKKSYWVAFDFDSIVGHKDGLSNVELENIENTVSKIDWITLRKSTSGKGLHVYVKVPGVPTNNHNEHAALSRAILGKMSAITGYDFSSKVDICGGNMWVWHRKMAGTDGLKLIKSGNTLHEIPLNWLDHLGVITNTKNKVKPQFIPDGSVNVFDELTGQRPKIPLDETHKALINWLETNNCVWWWVQDHHMLVTHTFHLLEAHEALKMRGIFKTNATGKERGSDHNCYCFPMRRGAWSVRRYTPGVSEADSWSQDSAGWTVCYFNRDPDLSTASRSFNAIEHPAGGFVFREAEVALKALKELGVHTQIPVSFNSRETKIKAHKDGRVVVEIEKKDNDILEGWLPEKGKWKRIFSGSISTPNEPETANYDDVIRHLVTEANQDYGWMIKSDGKWKEEPLTHVRASLKSIGVDPKSIDVVIGNSVMKCWTVVNKPFQPEYPGDRQWNKNAAQFRFAPSQNDNLTYPTWNAIFNHVGKSLDNAVTENGWCAANGIISGADYLKCWVASLFQSPFEPLPYLFLYGPQNSGKSILHEAISLLLTKGFQRADNALVSQSGFNAELQDAILCIVEETDLKRNQQAYNRIKDWVTSRQIPIHRKGETPYTIPNATHWIQCANNYDACPVFSGDTRITMIFVDSLDPLELIPKREMLQKLEKEAPEFLASILKLEVPKANDRLGIPVIVTEDKLLTEELNQNDLQRFIKECTHSVPGEQIKFSEFHSRFLEWLEPNEVPKWTKVRVGRELGPSTPKGRNMNDGAQLYVGNISWDKREATKPKLIVVGEKLVHQHVKDSQNKNGSS